MSDVIHLDGCSRLSGWGTCDCGEDAPRGDSAQRRADVIKARIEAEIEVLARELCDTYYLTVDPDRKMSDAYDKITGKTRVHWRAQARLLIRRGWRKQ